MGMRRQPPFATLPLSGLGEGKRGTNMSIRKHILATCAVIALVPAISATASAKSFKAKYYKECYAGVKDVAKLVKPKESMQKKGEESLGPVWCNR